MASVNWSLIYGFSLCVLLPHLASAEDVDRAAAVPDAASQRSAGKTIDGLYKSDIAGARAPGQKSALAARYLSAATDSTDDTAARFVLLTRARDLAADAGDIATALGAVDQLGTAFRIDRQAAKSEIVERLAKRAHTTGDCADLAGYALAAANDSADAGHYDVARRMSQHAIEFARKSGDPILLARAAAADLGITQEEPAFHRAERALALLAKDPQNPKANEDAGFFYCYSKGNWERGLPMLARSGSPAVQALAGKELAGPTLADAQLEIADGWWSLADGRKEPEKGQIRKHASSWYQQSLTGLSGLSKTRAEKRMKDATTGGPTTLTLANVSFSENMGYIIGTMRPGVQSHSNRENAVVTVPEALIGKPYTQVISGDDLGVKIRFETAGDLFVLSEKFPGRPSNASQVLGAIGRRLDSESFTCSSATPWEVWVVSGKAGQQFEIPFQVMLIAENLRKFR